MSPAEILLVGDDPRADLSGAIAAGWRGLLLDRRGSAIAMPKIATLSQLLDFIPSLSFKRVSQKRRKSGRKMAQKNSSGLIAPPIVFLPGFSASDPK